MSINSGHLSLALFAIGAIVVVYAANAIAERRLPQVRLKLLILYVTTMAAFGVSGEIFVGSLYQWLFHAPLWHWQVLPIYSGYTSSYGPFLWGIYGFLIYLTHLSLDQHTIRHPLIVALIFGFESIAVEILVNLSFLACFGHNVFYYYPSDLWHLSSVQAFPFFFGAGAIFAQVIRIYRRAPLLFSIWNIAFCILLVVVI